MTRRATNTCTNEGSELLVITIQTIIQYWTPCNSRIRRLPQNSKRTLDRRAEKNGHTLCLLPAGGFKLMSVFHGLPLSLLCHPFFLPSFLRCFVGPLPAPGRRGYFHFQAIVVGQRNSPLASSHQRPTSRHPLPLLLHPIAHVTGMFLIRYLAKSLSTATGLWLCLPVYVCVSVRM